MISSTPSQLHNSVMARLLHDLATPLTAVHLGLDCLESPDDWALVPVLRGDVHKMTTLLTVARKVFGAQAAKLGPSFLTDLSGWARARGINLHMPSSEAWACPPGSLACLGALMLHYGHESAGMATSWSIASYQGGLSLSGPFKELAPPAEVTTSTAFLAYAYQMAAQNNIEILGHKGVTYITPHHHLGHGRGGCVGR